MNVKIEVGKPVVVPADATGPAYNTYPISVRAEGEGIRQVTLSANGSRVAESHTGVLRHALSGKDLEHGTIPLFASVTDGNETVTTESSVSHSVAVAPAPKSSQQPGTVSSTPAK